MKRHLIFSDNIRRARVQLKMGQGERAGVNAWGCKSDVLVVGLGEVGNCCQFGAKIVKLQLDGIAVISLRPTDQALDDQPKT